MTKKFLATFWFFLFLCSACSTSPLSTGLKSDENLVNMTYLKEGMTDQQVAKIMGRPYLIEKIDLKNKTYVIWYYITSATHMGQKKVHQENLTPVVFEDHILKGTGYHYLKHVREDQELQKSEDAEQRRRYKEQEGDWPKNEHGFVPAPGPTKAPHVDGPEYEDESKAIEETLDEQNQESKIEEDEPALPVEEPSPKPKKEKLPRGVCPPKKGDKSYWWE